MQQEVFLEAFLLYFERVQCHWPVEKWQKLFLYTKTDLPGR